MGKHGAVIWLTGISGSGKTTLANMLYEYFQGKGVGVERLDGDLVRKMFPQTGFTKEERDVHIKRVGELAAQKEREGAVVVCSFISPYRQARREVRGLCRNFVEVYVKASVAACEKRDVKGLYRKARSGEIRHFTGIDDPYEQPESPEIIVDTDVETVEESFSKIVEWLSRESR